MKREEKIKDLCDKIISKLETELNSKTSSLIDPNELRERASAFVDNENAFDYVYPHIYRTAAKNLSSNIFPKEDSFSFDENGCNSNDSSVGSTLKDNNGICISLPPQNTEQSSPASHQDSVHKESDSKPKSPSINVTNEVESEGNFATAIDDDDDACPVKISEVFCSLLPDLNKSEIELKLKDNSNDSGYRVKLLEECIIKTLEKEYDVNERVFLKLEEWQKVNVERRECENSDKYLSQSSGTHLSFNSAQNMASLSYSDQNEAGVSEEKGDSANNIVQIAPHSETANLRENAKFLSEVIPGQNIKKMNERYLQCSTSKVSDFISRYLVEGFDSSHVTENKNGHLESFVSQTKSIERGTMPNAPSHSRFSELISESGFEKDDDDDAVHNGENDKGCVIVDVVNKRKLPLVINLDEEASSPASSSSDIVLVEEFTPQPQNNVIHEPNEQSHFIAQQQRISSPLLFALNETPVNVVEEDPAIKHTNNIEIDALPWTEAQSICRLLPFLQLGNIHRSIIDNYYHPQRKAKVLAEYIQLALEEGHDISDDVLETHTQWQTNKKRTSDSDSEDIQNGNQKRQRQTDEQTSQLIPQPSASTSRVADNIPVEQPLPPVEPLNSNAPMAVQTFFNSLPEESKLWYQKKVDFLAEVTINLSKQYILSQIIHCQTESDIMHVATRLLEEQTTNILQSNSSEMLQGLPLNLETQELGAVGSTNLAETAEATASEEATPSTSSKDDSSTNQISAADIEDKIQTHIHQLGEIFPNADPDFLSERANEVAGDEEKFTELVQELVKNGSYPKMEEYLKRQQKMNMRKKFIEGMSVEEFMEYFEDPEKVFFNTTTEMSKLYMKNAKAQLMKDLPFHLSRTIDSVFRENYYHYLPTLRALRSLKGARKTKRTVGGKQPGDLDDVFIKELCYAKMEDKIKENYQQKEFEKELSFQRAKERGELKECCCCYDDSVLSEDMSACDNMNDPHFFCNTCIKRYSEEQIGQGKQDFICIEGECKSPFSLNTLKRLLKPAVFSNLLQRKQAEEIAAAGIEDLELCPYCNFATIMPNKEDKVFKCLNPECLKDSCRLCKELNHIPLRCEEVEKKKQTDARTYVENEMSEAIVRECYKCKRRFIKEEGCNKMVCSCKAVMCYLCKKPIEGYGHFEQDSRSTTKTSGKCPLWSNSLQLHAEEVQQRAAEAKEKLDPDVDLLHDPTKDLPQVPDYLKKPQPNAQHNAQAAHGDGRQDDMDQLRNQLGNGGLMNAANYIPHMADFLFTQTHRNIQRHSHQHRHHHFYIPVLNPPPPPPQLPRPPVHLPPPPPAHQNQRTPPFPPFMEARAPPHFPVRLHPPPNNPFPPRPPNHPQGGVPPQNAHGVPPRPFSPQSVFNPQVNQGGFNPNRQRNVTANQRQNHTLPRYHGNSSSSSSSSSTTTNNNTNNFQPPNNHQHGGNHNNHHFNF